MMSSVDAFALADLDREQLEEVAVVVRRRGAGAFGSVEQSVRDVEADRPRARRGARRGVGGPNAGGVDERGDVRGEAARVPGGVARVRAEQSDRVSQPSDRCAGGKREGQGRADAVARSRADRAAVID